MRPVPPGEILIEEFLQPPGSHGKRASQRDLRNAEKALPARVRKRIEQNRSVPAS